MCNHAGIAQRGSFRCGFGTEHSADRDAEIVAESQLRGGPDGECVASQLLFEVGVTIIQAMQRVCGQSCDVDRRQGEALARLQTWIRQPSIAAENRGMEEGCKLTMEMFREAGFQSVSRIPTDGQPGIFATLDAGAPRTVGLYFMYDVKQADPSEWSSPPFEGAVVDKPGFGKVLVGRGAINQKGPEATFLAALHAITVGMLSMLKRKGLLTSQELDQLFEAGLVTFERGDQDETRAAARMTLEILARSLRDPPQA